MPACWPDLGNIRLGAHYRSGIKHDLKGDLTISGLQGCSRLAMPTFARTPA
jgi:hypothetical protein